jgi:hypothetical protein
MNCAQLAAPERRLSARKRNYPPERELIYSHSVNQIYEAAGILQPLQDRTNDDTGETSAQAGSLGAGDPQTERLQQIWAIIRQARDQLRAFPRSRR